MEKKITTERIRAKFHYLMNLEYQFEKFTNRPWYKKQVTVQEINDFVAIISNAKTSLWQEVYKTYPELEGNDTVSINSYSLTFEIAPTK